MTKLQVFLLGLSPVATIIAIQFSGWLKFGLVAVSIGAIAVGTAITIRRNQRRLTCPRYERLVNRQKIDFAKVAQGRHWEYDPRSVGYRDESGKLVADVFGKPIN